ncbi:unnamed protein product [Effrenium voratum]|nr:unnamed protein product [Effrenium voratum]
MMVGRSLPSRTANPGAQAQAAIRQAQDAIAAAHGSDPTGSTTSGPVGANLFVYHIPNSWDDHILRQHFEHFGKILSCRVQKDDSGRPRGFGFVSFDAPASAQAAIAGMHGFPVEGKWLKVQLKKGDEQQMEQAKEQVGGMPGMTVNQAAPPPPAPPPPAPPPPRDMGKSQGGDKGKKGFGKGDVGKPFGDGKGFGGFGDGKGFDASGKGFDGKGKGFDGKGLDSFDPKGFGKGNFMGNFPRPGPY